MAEGQDDARIAEIRARYAGLEKLLEDTTGQWDRSQLLPMVSELAGAAKTIPYLLERLDALTAERDLLRVERDIARRVEQESSAAADAWQAEAVKVRAERDALTAERDARIKTLENDLEHALASVGAFRQAIEKVFAKADEHEIDQGGMIVTYVLPCGPLHRAIGLARGTDAGGKLLAERDALAARLAAAEAALSPCTLALEYRDGVTCREERDRGVCLNHRVIEGLRVHAVTADRLEIENRALRRQVRATYGIIHEGLHGGKPTDPEHQELCERPSCRNARAALAGSREQAAGEGA